MYLTSNPHLTQVPLEKHKQRDIYGICWLDVWTPSNPRETLCTSMFQAFWVRCCPVFCECS